MKKALFIGAFNNKIPFGTLSHNCIIKGVGKSTNKKSDQARGRIS